jgi:Cdc6-like AAA superfamily ATPase
MAKKGANPVVLHPDANIGNSAAEADDEFLFECFVDHPALAALSDIDSPKLFASGRTGTGKTALLRMIERQKHNVAVVDLPELALGYVSNSDIIQFLSALGVDLDLFYQSLWRHIFCIEYIRLKYNVKSEAQSQTLFQRIKETFLPDKRRASAIEYLKNWESKFWITMTKM